MILVIADDFTGAAELAGIAIRFGLKAEVQTKFRMNRDTDVIILDTNSRSKSPEEAAAIMDQLLESLQQHEFQLLYKKTDSVLRGHIHVELSIILKYYPGKTILLVPANPSNGRIISDGTYFIDGQPLHETIFGKDPEAPVSTSDVSLLINDANRPEIEALDITEGTPLKHGMIYIANTKTTGEIEQWAHRLHDNLIPAGAADFFAAILQSEGHREIEGDHVNIDFDKQKTLFICGSSLSKAVNIEEELFSNNPAVVEISEEQLCTGHDITVMNVMIENVLDHFGTTNNVILFVNIPEDSLAALPTHNIPKCLANIASGIISRSNLDEIFIEGGTTSSEVVRKIGWTRFRPVSQLGHGVIRMQVVDSPDHHIIVKPGSYKWPDRLWNEAFNVNQGQK